MTPTATAKGLAVTKVRLEVHDADVKASVQDGRRMLSVGTVPEDALVAKLAELGMPSTGLLPANVLWISSTGRQVLFERPPRRITITYTPNTVHEINDGDAQAPITLSLPLPWTIYAAIFDRDYHVRNLKLYASNAQITSMDQYLSYLPLPNLYEDCRFCLPEYDGGYDEDDEFCCEANEDGDDCDCELQDDPHDIHVPQTPNLAGAIMSAYQKVWSSNFNHDLVETVGIVGNQGRPLVLFPSGPTAMTHNEVRKMMLRWEQLELSQVAMVGDWRPATSVLGAIQQLQSANQQNFNGYYVSTTINTMVQQLKTKAR